MSAKSVALGVTALAREAVNGLTATVVASGETVDVDLGVAAGIQVGHRGIRRHRRHAPASRRTAITPRLSSTTESFDDVDSNTVTTPGDRYDTTTTLISSLNPAEQHADVTFTATVTPAEGRA